MGRQLFAVGSLGPLDEWNPSYLIWNLNAWPMLESLRVAGRRAPDIAEQAGLDVQETQRALVSLGKLGVVQCIGGVYHLGFAWFSAADQELIHSASAPMAAELADRISAHARDIDRCLESLAARAWTSIEDLRFAIVGCFGLDWGGLDALKASGHLVHNKPQPGGRQYVMFVEDAVAEYKFKDYVGSHNEAVSPEYTWTSFGDHSGRRSGLPDFLWHADTAVAESDLIPTSIRKAWAEAMRALVGAELAEAMHAVTTGRTAPKEQALAMLTSLGGTKSGLPAVPVFEWANDGSAIEAVVDSIKGIVLQVVTEHYDALRANLGDLPAIRNGVPFGECFNNIWHVIFGQANRRLAEGGYLSDPEPVSAREGRYRWWLTVGKP